MKSRVAVIVLLAILQVCVNENALNENVRLRIRIKADIFQRLLTIYQD